MLKLKPSIFVVILSMVTLPSSSRNNLLYESFVNLNHNIGYAVSTTAGSDSAWQFKAGDKTYSGTIDKAIISPDKSALYFWGPSHQSADTIISVVAQFRSKFAADVEDVSSTETGFVFGKVKSAGMPVFSIDPSRSEFTVVVKNYNHQTKVAHGTISGTAKDSNGNDVEIKNGKFRVQL